MSFIVLPSIPIEAEPSLYSSLQEDNCIMEFFFADYIIKKKIYI